MAKLICPCCKNVHGLLKCYGAMQVEGVFDVSQAKVVQCETVSVIMDVKRYKCLMCDAEFTPADLPENKEVGK